jgi:localization factor PodJL
MNTRQSIYDTLNNGRSRRSSSLEDLEATLGGIEAKLERISPRPEANTPLYDDMAERMRRLSAEISTPRPLPSARTSLNPHNAPNMQNLAQPNLAQQIEAARKSDAMSGTMASLVGELQEMRAEMRRLANAQSAPAHDWNAAIRHEIEAIKHGIGSLAREDTLRSVENQWSQIGSQIAQRPAYDMSSDPVIEAMLQRIEGIQSAISGLPQSQTLSSLEEKIRILASAIDQLSRRSPETNGPQLLQIEDRLDEISRAIVASSVSVQPTGQDKVQFERLESKLLSLNERIEALVNGDHVADINKRIGLLSVQLEGIASRSGAPIEQMARMAGQLETIAAKISELDATKADPAAIASGLEDRLFEIAARLEHSNEQTGRESREVFSELEQRLEEMAARLNRPDQSEGYSAQILTAVEQRFADLSRQMTNERSDNGFDPSFAVNVERRLEDITNRLNASSAPVHATDPQALERLERQVQNLASKLVAPREDYSQFDQLNPRLAAIEQSLSANQDAILLAARQAAEDVIASAQFHPQSADGQAALGLANDLKVLEVLARKSDERNTKTFEAIHDTLLKIVDRLNSVETTKIVAAPGEAATAPKFQEAPLSQMPRAAKLDLGANTPPFDDTAFHDEPAYEDFEPVPVRSPVEAALAAAQAAKGMAVDLKKSAQPAEKGGLLAKLSRSVRRSEPKMEDALAGTALAGSDVYVEPQMQGQSGQLENMPIDPNTGTPDLNAIMKRVRDERKTNSDVTVEETAKADFLAAARRAAKAAADDVDILRAKSAKSVKKSEGGIAGLLQSQRKPIMLVAFAAILALTGLQLSKAFFSGDASNSVAVSENSAAQVDPAKSEPMVASQDVASQSVETPRTVEAAVNTNEASQDVPVTSDVTPVDQTQTAASAQAPKATDEVPLAAADAPKATSNVAPMMAEPVTTDSKAMEPAKAAETPAIENSANASAPADLPAADVGPIALREAAAKGDNKALFEVASRYADGRGVSKDPQKAAQWFQKAADAGFAPAQFRLGSFYEKGSGVERSAQKAKEFYQLAAEQGNASAMHNLAVLYATGAAGPADNDSAAQWFVKAAELGVRDSQFNLGILAAKGLGVARSLEESYKWFALAAKSGDKDAAGKRDEIANVMRPDQLQKARATAELWKAKPVNPDANSVQVPESWNADGGQTASVEPVDMTKAIRNIQVILNKNGYDAGAPDGKIGAQTTKAITAYQKANGMPATGLIDEALINSLLKKVKS